MVDLAASLAPEISYSFSIRAPGRQRHTGAPSVFSRVRFLTCPSSKQQVLRKGSHFRRTGLFTENSGHRSRNPSTLAALRTKDNPPSRGAKGSLPPVEIRSLEAPPIQSTGESPSSSSRIPDLENEKVLTASATTANNGSGATFFRRQFRILVRRLANLPLAIGELFVIAGFCAIGTVIDQGEPPASYLNQYTDENPLYGFLTGPLILALGLDHVYSAPYFLCLLLLLGSSLAACTFTRQLPLVRISKRWSFLRSSELVLKQETSDVLPRARLLDLATLLMANGYEVFVKGPSLYAFKGLVGRFAPIAVHAALLLIMGGGTYSATGGYTGTTMTPQGLDFYLGNALVPRGILSQPSSVMNTRIKVNRFFVDYRPNGEVKQFFSDLSALDPDGREVFRKTISVNDPFRIDGVTGYQTDWAIAAVQVRVDESQPFNLPMADLAGNGDGQKLFGTFLPLSKEGAQESRGISILARDFQTVAIYDTQGNFAGIRRPDSGKPITVDGVQLVIEDIVGATGLELKMDPGVPWVYTGFGVLMLTSAISYLSHSQVWAWQEGATLYVGGKSNRAKISFAKSLHELLDLVPEVLAEQSLDSGGEQNNARTEKEGEAGVLV